MPFDRMDPAAIIRRLEAMLEGDVAGFDARTRRNNLAVLARIVAASEDAAQSFVAWCRDQQLPDTAVDELLDRIGGIWGVSRRPPAFAEGLCRFRGSQYGVADAGAKLRRADGAEYLLTVPAVIDATGRGEAPVQALAPGAGGNMSPGQTLWLVRGYGGVDGAVEVGDRGLVGGTDAETDDDYRRRILDRIRELPRGGSPADYVAWALTVPHVTRAWCFPGANGPGTVVVRFMTDGHSPEGIPVLGDIGRVRALLDEVRPVAVDLMVAAPQPHVVPINILLTPATAIVKAAVVAELVAMFRRDAAPGVTIRLSRIREAISIAAGERRHDLLSPTADVVVAESHIAILGPVNWGA